MCARRRRYAKRIDSPRKRLKDWFQNELESSLNHPVSDGRNREHAGLAAVLRDSYLPCPQGAIRTVNKLLAEMLDEAHYALLFDRLE